MSKIRASLVAIAAAFSSAVALPAGMNFASFASQFHIKKSGKGRSKGGRGYDWMNHYQTPWKEILNNQTNGAKECARRVAQMAK